VKTLQSSHFSLFFFVFFVFVLFVFVLFCFFVVVFFFFFHSDKFQETSSKLRKHQLEKLGRGVVITRVSLPGPKLLGVVV